jgi:hypothetical protein
MLETELINNGNGKFEFVGMNNATFICNGIARIHYSFRCWRISNYLSLKRTTKPINTNFPYNHLMTARSEINLTPRPRNIRPPMMRINRILLIHIHLKKSIMRSASIILEPTHK